MITKLPYVCVSYRWGSKLTSYDILINGLRFPVWANLFSLLETARRSDLTSQYLWIDAICIAQEDVQERNHQVSQMGSIFSAAELVYVWLGRRRSLESAIWCLQNWEHDAPTIRLDPYCQLDKPSRISQYLFHNKYWHRAWITQEFLLALRIIIFLDEMTIDFKKLFEALRHYDMINRELYLNNGFCRHVSNRYLRIQNIRSQPLIRLLNHFSDKECSLPQDRVFSLLDVCSDATKVAVDYEEKPSNLALKIIANHTDPSCICEIVQVFGSLGCSTESLHNNTKIRILGAENIHVKVNEQGIKLTNGTAYALLDHKGAVCPILEEAVYNIAKCIFGEEFDWSNESQVPTDSIQANQGTFFRRLASEDAFALSQDSRKHFRVFEILGSVPDSRTYSLQLDLRSIVDMHVKPANLCLVHQRCNAVEIILPKRGPMVQ